jgi:hypothetical protein
VSGLTYVLILVWWLAVLAFVALAVTAAVKVLRNRGRDRGQAGDDGGRDDRVRAG